jgi:branched-chain amino acid aminotransferase
VTQTATNTQRQASAAPADRPIVHVNGTMVPRSQAMVSVFDHGLLYGDGVFEGIRVYRGRIFKLGQHMDRLWECARRIGLTIPISREEMIKIQRQCVEANEIIDGYIRLIVTRGEGTLGLNPNLCPRAGIICIADQIRLYPPEMYEQGMKVIVAERPKTPIACLDPRIKSLNYLNNILAKVEAIEVGLLEVVMLNLDGKVTEGSGDNIFFVKDGVIYTPPSDAGILEGITRRFVMQDLAPAEGVKCVEKEFGLDELLAADEVFLTGSAAEMIAVSAIGQKNASGGYDFTEISKGEGPITAKLRARFRQIVTSDGVPED